MKIYLDNCCFNRPFDDQTKKKILLETSAKLYVQDEILEGNLELVWSYILDYENKANPFEERKRTIERWKELSVDDCVENDTILNKAQEITTFGVKAKDALHIACAIFMRCNYFLTTDVKLLKKNIKGIEIVSPIEFVERMEDDEL